MGLLSGLFKVLSFSKIFSWVQGPAKAVRLTDVGAAMKNCISTPALASLGDGMGKAMEYAYVGAGVPMEGLMDSVTTQR